MNKTANIAPNQSTFITAPQVRLVTAAVRQPIADVGDGECPLCGYAWRAYKKDGKAISPTPYAEGVGTAGCESNIVAGLRAVLAALEFCFEQEIAAVEIVAPQEIVASVYESPYPLPYERHLQGRLQRAHNFMDFILLPDNVYPTGVEDAATRAQGQVERVVRGIRRLKEAGFE